MDRVDRLEELLVDWEQQRRQGNELTVQELCKDHPELVADLYQLIADFKATDWLEQDDSADDDFLHLPDFSTVTNRADDTRLPTSGITLDQFWQRLVESGLMDADDVAKYRKLYPATNALAFAQQLVSSKMLTGFQATVLLEGRDLPLVLDRYVILDELGAGGMGAVYKALHQQMDRVVALKILPKSVVDSSEKIKRFQREVKAAAKLHHQNIVVAHDATESKGTHFLVMEMVDGQDLAKLVRKNGPFSVAKAVDYIAQTARGLEHAHGMGIIHRDIKPANLLLDKKGVVKILDMGLARMESTEPEAEHTVSQELTQAGMVMGTIAYLAPEQALDTRHADARSDMYSLGCTLFYLLTGNVPYHEDTMMKTIMAHREGAIPSLCDARQGVPAELDAIFQKMVTKQPADRFQTMTELLDALEQLALPEADVQVTQQFVPASETQCNTATSIDTSREVIRTQPSPPCRSSGTGKSKLLVFAAAAAVVLLAGIIYRIQTDKGTITVELADESIAAKLTTSGVIIEDGDHKWTVNIGNSSTLPAGDSYSARLSKDSGLMLSVTDDKGTELDTAKFQIRRNGKILVKVAASAPTVVETETRSTSSENWALEFDGENDYVELSTLEFEAVQPLTFEAWCRVLPGKTLNEDNVDPLFVSNTLTQISTGNVLIYSREHAGYWMASQALSDKSAVSTQLYMNNRIREGQVCHIAAVWNGNESGLYYDGELVDNLSKVMPPVNTDYDDRHLPPFIGKVLLLHSMKQRFFQGVISEVRISNIARYTEDFKPEQRFEPDEHTLALYHFDEGNGDVLKDSSGNGHHGKIYGAKWTPRPASAEDRTSHQNNRSVAEWVLSIGGWIATPESRIDNPNALTDDDTVVSVMLYSNPKVSDADIGRLAVFENLAVLALSNTNISDAAIEHICRIRTLELLDLQNSQVTGKGLRQLASLTLLRTLWANGLKVSDADIEALATLPRIEELSLSDPAITDDAVVFLKAAKSLRKLNLQGTSVSAAGKAEIQMAIPGCRVN